MTKRRAGVLMPIFSLPSPYGIGTFGKDAYKFIDFLKKAGQKVWQVLPLVPTGFGDSPYSSSCSYAGNPYFIDVDFLKDDGLLSKAECESYSCDNGDNKIDYSQLFNKRIALLKLAFSRFDKKNEAFKSFLLEGEFNAYSLFMAIKEKFDYKKLNAWDSDYKKRDKKTLESFEKENRYEFEEKDINKKEDYYTKGREKISDKLPDKAKKYKDYIFVLPDIAALIYRLLRDKRVSVKTKVIISAGLSLYL